MRLPKHSNRLDNHEISISSAVGFINGIGTLGPGCAASGWSPFPASQNPVLALMH